jgi:hypothetical protein
MGKNSTEEDRRSHIRIRDRVLLHFRPIEKEEYQRTIAAYRNGTASPWIGGSPPALGKSIQGHIRRIRDRDEALANILEAMDQKLGLILSLLNTDREEIPAEPHEIDLSAAGIAFLSASQLSVGQIMEIDLGLLPQRLFLRCYGEVVRCEKVERRGFATAVSFLWITEDDKDRLIEHIFQRQVLLLRIRRNQKDREEEE